MKHNKVMNVWRVDLDKRNKIARMGSGRFVFVFIRLNL